MPPKGSLFLSPEYEAKIQALDSLVGHKLITPEERLAKKQTLIEQNVKQDNYIDYLTKAASDAIQENWPSVVKALTAKTPLESVVTGPVQLGLAGFNLLYSLAVSPFTAAGEGTTYDLIRHGANPKVAALIGTINQSAPDLAIGISQVAGIIGGGILNAPRNSPEQIKAVWDWLKAGMGYAKMTPEIKANAEVVLQEHQNALNLIDVTKPAGGQDIGLGAAGRGGVMQGERLGLPAPAEITPQPGMGSPRIARVDEINMYYRPSSMNQTAAILRKSAEPIPTEPLTPTQSALETAKATLSPQPDLTTTSKVAKKAIETAVEVPPSSGRISPFGKTIAEELQALDEGRKPIVSVTPMDMTEKGAKDLVAAYEDSKDVAWKMVGENQIFYLKKNEADALKRIETLKTATDPATKGRALGYSEADIKEFLTPTKPRIIVGGGAPSMEDYQKEMISGAKRYKELLDQYQGHGLTRAEAESQAEGMFSSGDWSYRHFNATMPGQARNPQQTLVGVKIMNETLDNTFALRDKAMAGDKEAWDELTKQLARLSGQNPKYFGPRSVAGQTLGIYRTPTTGTTQTAEQFHDFWSWFGMADIQTPQDLERNKDRILSVLGMMKNREQIMQQLHTIPDPEVVRPDTWKDFSINFFVNNILSPITIGVKATADVTTAMYRGVLEKPTQAYLLRPLNYLSGFPRGIQQGDMAVGGEGMQFLYGWRSGLWKASKFLANGDLSGMDVAAYNDKRFMNLADFLDERFGKADAYLGTGRAFSLLGRGVGRTSQLVSPAINIVTNAARIAFMEAEQRALVFRQVSLEGNLKGMDLINEVDGRLLNVPGAIAKSALAVTDKYTFMGPLPGWGQALLDMRNKIQPLKYELPFVRAPINYTIWGFDRAPGTSYVSNAIDVLTHGNQADLLKGGVPAAQAGTDIILSTIVGGALLMQARAGYITGGGLGIDPRRIRQMQGINAAPTYSIMNPINGDYYSFHRYHPIGGILGTAGDLGEMWNQIPWNDNFNRDLEEGMGTFYAGLNSLGTGAGAMGIAISRNYMDQPTFQGVIDLARVVEGVGRGTLGGEGWAGAKQSSFSGLAHFTEGFIPGAGIVKNVARSLANTDIGKSIGLTPAMQEAQTFTENLAKDFSISIERPHINILGNTQYSPDTLGPKWGSAVNAVDAEKITPLAKELDALQFEMGQTRRTLYGSATPQDKTRVIGPKEGIPLKDEEWYNFDKRRKEMFGELAQQYFDSPEHETHNRYNRIAQYQKYASQAETNAQNEMVYNPENTDLRERIQAGLTRQQLLRLSDDQVGQSQSNLTAMDNFSATPEPPPPSPSFPLEMQ